MREDCKSLKASQKRRARQLPFRQFCQALASDLTVEVVSPLGYERSGSEDDDIMKDDNDILVTDGGESKRRRLTHQQSVLRICYNKREAYFSKAQLISPREADLPFRHVLLVLQVLVVDMMTTSGGSAEGAMVAGNPGSGNDDDESSPERLTTRQRTCSTITAPVRRSRRSRLS